ncbi:MAG: hypothetical protein ABIQ88_12365 [Chitinophagaceae bacterium]
MKVISTVIAILYFSSAFCQQDLALFRNDAYGRPLYLLPNFKSEGSPNYSDDYHIAAVTLENGKVYNNLSIKLNLVTHTVQYLEDGKEMVTTAPVKKIMFINLPDEDGFRRNVQLETFTSALNAPDAAVFEVLDTGKIKLVKKITITYRDDRKYNEAATTRIFERKEIYYSVDESAQPKRIEKGKSALLTIFPDNRDKVASFIDQQKLSCRTEADFKRIFSFYNSLTL